MPRPKRGASKAHIGSSLQTSKLYMLSRDSAIRAGQLNHEGSMSDPLSVRLVSASTLNNMCKIQYILDLHSS